MRAAVGQQHIGSEDGGEQKREKHREEERTAPGEHVGKPLQHETRHGELAKDNQTNYMNVSKKHNTTGIMIRRRI